jgi:hypothetical protein
MNLTKCKNNYNYKIILSEKDKETLIKSNNEIPKHNKTFNVEEAILFATDDFSKCEPLKAKEILAKEILAKEILAKEKLANNFF